MTPPQLSLFDSSISRQPLPLEVAQKYGFALQYHTTDDDTIMYAVQDWIAGVAQTTSAARFWNDLKKRLEKAKIQLYASCVQLPYRASNGKTYQMDFASDETLYRIVQRMDVDTGIRTQVMDFLAKAGAFVDEMRQDPESVEVKLTSLRQTRTAQIADKKGKSDEWVTTRDSGVMTRKQFTAMLLAVNPDTNIGRATNGVYKGVFGQDAAGLRKTLSIGQKENPRDHMSRLGLMYTMVAEEVIRLRLQSYGENDIVSEADVYATITALSKATGTQAADMARIVGVDLVTGRPLLSAGH